ncbi:MAG: 1,4-alpha-glucan-branching enzyme, partial [Clostridia bacterium]|nr:1,4-alpha-glucan-branching enzyme [Clostridia bacterium]
MSLKILKIDPYLKPYEDDLNLRMNNYTAKRKELIGDGNIVDFADGYKYFGVHPTVDGWVYREWAPAAE